MMLIETVIYFLQFSLLSVLTFYSLGHLIIQLLRVKSEPINEIVLSYALGIVSFILMAVVLGFLNLRQLSLPLILAIFLFNLYRFKLNFFYRFKSLTQFKWLILILLLGIVVQGLINFPSGYLYNGELHFWSSQGHDGIWHVALMEEVKKSFPPQNPIYSGELLFNYHYLGDVMMGEFARIFPIFSSLDLYFRFYPVLFSALMGLAAFAFVRNWQKNDAIAYLAMLTISCVGSLGFIVTYLKHGNFLSGETVFWVSQNNTILGNPPHAMAFVLILTFLLGFSHFLENRNWRWLVVCTLLGLILSGIKVSGAMVLLIGLGLVSLYELVVQRKFQVLALTAVLGITNLVTIKSLTRGVESFLIFEPWWFIRTMVVGGDRLDWIDMEHRRQHYLAQHSLKGYLRVIELETEAFLIFLIGNAGVRILGLWQIVKGKITQIEVLMLGIMLSGFLIPMLFLQKGISFNIIQFMQYFLLILGFYGAVTVYKLYHLKKAAWWRVSLVGLVLFFSLPTVLGNLVDFYGPGRSPLSKVSVQELEALTYLKKNTNEDDLILNVPFEKYFYTRYKSQPLPNYAWYSTAYIPALASRRTYLSDEEQATITGLEIGNKKEKMIKFFAQEDFEFNKQFLIDTEIDYIYVAKPQLDTQLDEEKNNLQLVFENSEIVIYQVLQ